MTFTEPAENLKNLDLREGSKVADFGAGSGYYSLAAANRVRAMGQVYAIDVQKDLLSKIQTSAREKGLHNIQVVWGDIDKIGGTKLKDNYVNAVIVSNVIFQSEQKEDLAKEAFRIISPGGQVMVIDWSDSFGGLGPTQNQIVPEEEAKMLFEGAGFVYERSFFAGDHHWGIIMKKP